MQTHEKVLAAVIVAAVLAVVTSPRWLPAIAAPAPRAAEATPAPDVDVAPPRSEPLPPFDPAAFAAHVETAHYAIASNATPEQTREAGAALEALHAAYSEFCAGTWPPPPARHQVALYRDRADFRALARPRGGVRGYYRRPVCHAYYDAEGGHPLHWMLHEATHQLDTEWAGFARTPWVEEGLAAYFATSRLDDAGVLHPGEIDARTYPPAGLEVLRLRGDREADFAAGRLVHLRELIDADEPPTPADVNRYYVGYWSLAHFLLHGEGGRHAAAFRAMVDAGGSLEQFEKRVGPVDAVEARWYAYLLERRVELRARPAR